MKLRSILLAAAASLITATLVAQGQVPNINSTLNSVFTLAYDQSTMKPTYSATKAGITAPSAGGDICLIYGSATKNVRVRRLIISGQANVAAAEPIAIIKRSTAVANLTIASGLMPGVGYDSINSLTGAANSATAMAEFFTGNAAYGTVVGALADIIIPIGSSTVFVQPYVFTFGELGSATVLRGIAQSLSADLGYVVYPTLTPSAFSCTWEWTEE